MTLSKSSNVVMHAILFVLCVFGINGKPSLSFNLPAIGPFGKVQEKVLKIYSGRRVQNDSIRMVYFNELTVAIVELGPRKLLLNCELIELYEADDLFKTLGDLRDMARPVGITFKEMITLMEQCKTLEDMRLLNKHQELSKNSTEKTSQARGILANNPFSILSGIIPGTKWCGTGDIAKDYFDLGTEALVDTCCRAHDLCPIKVRAHSQNYNLTNNSLYTKSHCECDDNLYECLKHTTSQTASIMGNIYFNLVQVPCIQDTDVGKTFRNAKSDF